jgi:hypothetical protein
MNGSNVVRSETKSDISIPHFYRLTIRARRPVAKYALRIEFEMFGNAHADDTLPFWIGGRLGFFDALPI